MISNYNPDSQKPADAEPAAFTAAEAELVLRGLAAECQSSGCWTEARSAADKVAALCSNLGEAAAAIASMIAGRAEESAAPQAEGQSILRGARKQIEQNAHDEASRELAKALADPSRVDPLSVRAEMVALLAGICAAKGEIGTGLDLFPRYLPIDLVTASRDIGPAAAAMQAELLSAAGEKNAASEIAARLKLLWPRDPIVSGLLERVLR